MIVHLPKAKHPASKASCVVLSFPKFRPHVNEALQIALQGFGQPGNPHEWIFSGFRREVAWHGNWRGVNLRTRLEKSLP